MFVYSLFFLLLMLVISNVFVLYQISMVIPTFVLSTKDIFLIFFYNSLASSSWIILLTWLFSLVFVWYRLISDKEWMGFESLGFSRKRVLLAFVRISLAWVLSSFLLQHIFQPIAKYKIRELYSEIFYEKLNDIMPLNKVIEVSSGFFLMRTIIDSKVVLFLQRKIDDLNNLSILAPAKIITFDKEEKSVFIKFDKGTMIILNGTSAIDIKFSSINMKIPSLHPAWSKKDPSEITTKDIFISLYKAEKESYSMEYLLLSRRFNENLSYAVLLLAVFPYRIELPFRIAKMVFLVLILTLLYYVIVRTFVQLGKNNIILPVFAPFVANLIFLLIAYTRFFLADKNKFR